VFRAVNLRKRTRNRRQYPNCRHPLASVSANENVSLKQTQHVTHVPLTLTSLSNKSI